MTDEKSGVMNNRSFTVELIKSVLSVPSVILLLIICFWGSLQQIEHHIPQLLSNIKIIKFKDFALEVSEKTKLSPNEETREILAHLSKKDLLKLSNLKAYTHTPSEQFAQRTFGKLIELGLVEHVIDNGMPKDKYVVVASQKGKDIQNFLDELILTVLDEL